MSDTTVTPDSASESESTPNERRALLRRLALGGAGAAAGAVLLGKTVEAAPAAVNGEPITAGETNLSTTPTGLVMDPAAAAGATGPSSLSVSNAASGFSSAPYPANVGGYGNAEVVHGVHGSTTAPAGFGVVAANLSPAAGAATDPVPTAQAVASPNGAHLLLLAGGASGPAAGKHVAGEVYVDKDGTLWFTVPAPTTADPDTVRFVRLAGTSTSGSYNTIEPQRAYDSRQPNYAEKGVMAPNSSRVISIADGHSANGTVTLANAVPEGATAVQINVTAADTTGPNFLAVTAGDTAATETSLLNWTAVGAQIANSITVPVDASRQIKVFCGDQTGSTHVIIDVFGYYL